MRTDWGSGSQASIQSFYQWNERDRDPIALENGRGINSLVRGGRVDAIIWRCNGSGRGGLSGSVASKTLYCAQ